ncbi:tRNA (guanosine(37)-N1)-methyltransferase TrmD [Lactiplantibacillus sp. WILCCON 0030]|uniref:tRNA (guanine-N(1)-)-methyltransferase n=1 Tax=Lactiplantibacillus brownii TaxID=3069269 RepID=A0ABU1A8J9_9LACO|nr:tRNA (guanosine(37)-N1)-methyltransferase TrmD [Lactiplantibacillus brownii]MDQ7937292.1 tRNA (guanosine(37)-N1)-methyltransferase TrmD [Lactiplantibacillus brownii]
MRIDILSLFPHMFDGPLHESMIGNAVENNVIDVGVTDFRDYTTDKHNHVDDYPYGGGAGMLLQPQPIFDALADVQTKHPAKGRVILLDPAGYQFNQTVAEDFAKEDHLTFICGHYEGYDERIRSLVTDEVSLGDYVLTGGELGAMVMIDATVRLIPGVLGNAESAPGDSFSTGLLEYPQYTRPADFRGLKVPDILLSGDHGKIDDWRLEQALKRTYERRPDMLKKLKLSGKARQMLADIQADATDL